MPPLQNKQRLSRLYPVALLDVRVFAVHHLCQYPDYASSFSCLDADARYQILVQPFVLRAECLLRRGTGRLPGAPTGGHRSRLALRVSMSAAASWKPSLSSCLQSVVRSGLWVAAVHDGDDAADDGSVVIGSLEDDELQVFYGVLARCFVRLVRAVALDVPVVVVFTAVLQVLIVSYGSWFVHAPGAAGIL